MSYADVLGEDDPTRSGLGPQAMISSIVPRIYERVWRPLLAPVLTAGRLDELAMALEMLELRPGDSVLDVGCGPGNFTRALARASFDGLAVGLDASRRAAAISSATPTGPPVVGVGRRDWPATSLASLTTTAWILVPPRSIPPRKLIASKILPAR